MKAQNHQLTRQSHYTKNSFMPLICRASINDVKLSADFKDHSFSSFSGDPSSPKVSCIGQIKKNTKLIIPFSATTPNYTPQSSTATATASSAAHIATKSNGQVKYITLKKWFSAKNLTTNAPTSTDAAVHGGENCRSGGKEMRSYVISTRRSSKINNNDEGNSNNNNQPGSDGHVNLKELDPPLPVVKKAAQPPSDVNLWNRRSGGVALQSLQIKQQQINLHNNNNQPAPTV